MRSNSIGLKTHWGEVLQPATQMPQKPSETLSIRSRCSGIQPDQVELRWR